MVAGSNYSGSVTIRDDGDDEKQVCKMIVTIVTKS